MAEGRVHRRLAAILAADVVGYSRMMEADETGTLSRLKTLRAEILHPKVGEYGGRIVKTTGDGTLVEFPSAVDAVSHAVAVQAELARRNADLPEDRRIVLRMGINVGDIIIEGDDIYGDGVNIAARLESLAKPGEISVSGTVYDQVRGKLAIKFINLGEQSLKNIAEPVRVYQLAFSQTSTKGAVAPEGLLRRPAIAVLPFDNLSGDSGQDFFGDGLTEEIITALSRWRSFPVIARNSTFSYKGRSADVRKVGEELGARYVVEGTVRRAGDRVRVTAQLLNAETGHHIWAERYDREIADIFDLQDEITQKIAAIIEPTIERDERQRISSRPPSGLAAWEYCLRGYALIYEQTKEASEQAREMFLHAIQLDPNYARAHAGLGWTYGNDLRFFHPLDRDEWLRRLFEAGQRAVLLDENDPEARITLVRGYLLASQPEEAVREAEIATRLTPHSAMANNIMGGTLSQGLARYEEALPWFERALRLNPADPRQQVFLTQLALTYVGAEKYEQGIQYARDAIRRQPDFLEARIALASAYGYLGQSEWALKELEGVNVNPFELVEDLFYVQDLKERLIKGLRMAGVPASNAANH